MAITNATLAQAISNLIGYWDGFNEQYRDWLGGSVGGGPNSDGQYPLTDYQGNTDLVDSPAKLSDSVSNTVTGALAHKNAAEAAQVAAESAQTAAELAETNAETAEAGAVSAKDTAVASDSAAQSAKNTAVAQANLATDRVSYATEWANKAFNSLISAAAGGNETDEYSARHWAEVASGFAGDIDANLYARLTDNEVITGIYQHNANLRMANNVAISARNAANTAWRNMIYLDSSDIFQIGGSSLAVSVNGQLYATSVSLGNNTASNYLKPSTYTYHDSATGGIRFRDTLSASKGFIYHNGTDFGFLNSAGNWFLKNLNGTVNVLMYGDLGVTGAVTGSNLNVSNWDTAYGWGNHALGGYAPIDAPVFTTSAEAAYGVLSTSVDYKYGYKTGSFTYDADTLLHYGMSGYNDSVLGGISTALSGYYGLRFFRAGASKGFLDADGWTFEDAVTLGGRLYAGGAGWEVDPATAIFAQYNAAEAYIQIPNATGSFSIWNGSTGRIANFNDNGITTLYGTLSGVGADFSDSVDVDGYVLGGDGSTSSWINYNGLWMDRSSSYIGATHASSSLILRANNSFHWQKASDGTPLGDINVSTGHFEWDGDFTSHGSVKIDVNDNAASILTIGEPTTLRGDAQDSYLYMYGEHTGVIYGASISTISSNMQFAGVGANPVVSMQIALGVDILSGNWFKIRDATNADSALFAHDGVDFNTTLFGTTDWNISGITTLQVDAAIAATGAVTGSNLNVSDWDTAYGWGDHSGLYEAADAAIVKSDEIETITSAWNFSGTVSITGALQVRGNAWWYAAGKAYFYNTANTVWGTIEGNDNGLSLSHSSGSIYLNPAVIAGSSIAATGAVTGSNLNVSNWDTAYGWGDHASTYELLSAKIIRHVTTGYNDGEITVASSAPGSPSQGDIWFDTS